MSDNPRFDYIKAKIEYVIDDNDCQYNGIVNKMFDYIDTVWNNESCVNNIPNRDLLEKIIMEIEVTADCLLQEKIDNQDFDDDDYTIVRKLLFD